MESHAAVCGAIRPLVANADDVAYFANSGVRQPSPLPCLSDPTHASSVSGVKQGYRETAEPA